MPRTLIHVLVAFLAGGAVVSGVWSLIPTPKPQPTTAATAMKDGDDDALRKANANLAQSLQECDRKIDELRAGENAPAVAVAPSAEPSERNRGRDGGNEDRRSRGEPTKEDWERMAQLGTVRTRIPCLRDKPWTPNQRVVDKLGLSPQDTKVLQEAYEASNKRVMDQVRPVCAKVLGTNEAADKAGPSACMDAISNSARKSSPDATRESLVRVAEVQATKRPAPKPGSDLPPIEQLAFVLAGESKSFEDDLAKKLGPGEAKRLAWSPELCADRRTLRASDERE